MWWMLFHRWIWFLLGHCYTLLLYIDSCRVRAMPMSVAKVVYSHAGLCPNDLNPNLWVDAMSTCMRECESDQVSSLNACKMFACSRDLGKLDLKIREKKLHFKKNHLNSSIATEY